MGVVLFISPYSLYPLPDCEPELKDLRINSVRIYIAALVL